MALVVASPDKGENMKEQNVSRSCKKYKEWKKKVLERDKNQCTKCGSTKYLHCDHIKSWKEFPELRFDTENGQILCAGCHLKKGRENKEIINDINTRFKKGQSGHRKGIKTGKPSWNSGKKMSEESKRKLSEAKKGSTPWNKGTQ